MHLRTKTLLLALLVPILIASLLQLFFPLTFSVLWAYILGVALAFKSALMSLWLASKLKIIAFVKGLTLTQTLILTLKRWFIDNVLSQWIKKHILVHLQAVLHEVRTYYRQLDLRTKLIQGLMLIIPAGVMLWIFYLGDWLGSLALTAEIKLLVSGFFKAIWLLAAQAGNLLSEFAQSALAPIAELLALGFLLQWLERRLGPGHPVNRFLEWLGSRLRRGIRYLILSYRRYIVPHITKKISTGTQKLSEQIVGAIHHHKITRELDYFDRVANLILEGHIDAYHHFEDMHRIRDKKALYARINARTRDNLDIIGFVSRDREGRLVEEAADNDFYHDLFILEGMASHKDDGVTPAEEYAIDHTDFWAMNTSAYPVTLKSKSGNFATVTIPANSLFLIRTTLWKRDKTEDIIASYQDREVPVIPIEGEESQDDTG